jgi:Arc/MetJ-type ribon-helix-helix transcriptional regulator
MARMISLRLDEEAARALEQLTRDGASQSEAVREALIVAARLRRDEQLRAEAEMLAADPEDRAEAARILAFMESLDAEG